MAEDIDTRKNPVDHVSELKDLVVGYARQETVDPLKSLGRYLGFGIGGSVLVGFGSVLMLLALLRGLQSWDVFDGSGAVSLVPYAVTFVAAVAVVGLAVYRITQDDQKGDPLVSAKITPDDIRTKLADIQDEATTTVEGARNQLIAVGAGLALLLVVVAFVVGRRGGIRRNTIIEVKRA